MIEISLPYVYKLSAAVQPLADIKQGDNLLAKFYVLWSAEAELNAFLNTSIYSSTLRAVKAPGAELLTAIRNLTACSEDKDREINMFEAYPLSNALTTFDHVLTAELNVHSAWWVTKKRGFDTTDLIKNAEICWSPELPVKVPDCIPDIRNAGKCIAFELPTAAGFHTMRATELVLWHFWDAVSNGKPRLHTGSMGDYIVELEKKSWGDPKTLSTMKQVKNLHRNKLMHPEVALDMDEAVELWGIAQSVVTAMLREIPPMSLVLAPPVIPTTTS